MKSQRHSTNVSTVEKSESDAMCDLVPEDTGWTVVNYKGNKPRMKGNIKSKKKGHEEHGKKDKEAEVT